MESENTHKPLELEPTKPIELSKEASELAYLLAWVETDKSFEPAAYSLSCLAFFWTGYGRSVNPETGDLSPARTLESFWLAFGELFHAGLIDVDPDVHLARPEPEQ